MNDSSKDLLKQSLVINDIKDEYTGALTYYLMHRDKRPYDKLLIHLETSCTPFLEKIYANNYEISEWQAFYLRIWEENTAKNDISSTSLLFRLGSTDIPIFQEYFKPFGGRVNMTTFIEFVCTFVFFTTEQILPLLLTISNVRSNRLITAEQMYKFIYLLKPTTDQINDLSDGMKRFQNDGHGNYQLSDFTSYLLKEPILYNVLYIMKTHIVTQVIKKELYTIIKKKITYYSKFSNEEEIIQPKESCCESFQRSLFSSYPPKYYYNYCPFYHKRNVEDLLFGIRQRYGYSVRINRTSSNTSRSQLNVRNAQHSSLRLHKLTYGRGLECDRNTPLSPLSAQKRTFF